MLHTPEGKGENTGVLETDYLNELIISVYTLYYVCSLSYNLYYSLIQCSLHDFFYSVRHAFYSLLVVIYDLLFDIFCSLCVIVH